MRIFLLVALVAATFTAIAAQPLLPAAAGDQVPMQLTAAPLPAGDFEHAPVAFAWALDPQQALAPPPPYQAQSRESWQTVDGTDLARGVTLRLTAKGAVIRVSPARGAAALRESDIELRAGLRPVPLQHGADAAQLQAAGMAVPSGSAVARVEAGSGDYRLYAAAARGSYVVHVFEPNSDIVLLAQTDRDHALGGEKLVLDVAMQRAGRNMADATAGALLVAPDGRNWPVAVIARQDGRLTAQVLLPREGSRAPGLWELQVFANANGMQRDARTAFAVAAATARFRGNYAVNAQRLRLALPIQTAAAGRYEARGTLYATAADKVLRPVAQAHAAAWFDRGVGILVLDFSRAQLPAGYGAPFEVRQLQLHDQTRLAPLEIRALGARF